MYEPRGHAAMSGAILQPPTRPDADWGVLFIEVSGCLPMCGHGTIGVATVLVETGMVEVVEPVTTIRLDTPAGLVVAEVRRRRRRAPLGDHPQRRRRTCVALDAKVEVPGFGQVRYDLAYGGNFYAIVDLDRFGLPFDRSAQERDPARPGLAIMAAINEQDRARAPGGPRASPGCHHVQLARARAPTPGTRGTRWRSTPAGSTGRPCGTGTSARMAQLHARGELALGDGLRQRVVHRQPVHRPAGRGDRRSAGCPAVVPTITGRAWVTGTAQ